MALDIHEIEAACRRNLAAIAECLDSCFDIEISLKAGRTQASTDAPPALGTPGVVVEIMTAEGSILVLLPESLPLPAWYRTPNESQSTRLKTLAAKWAISVLPEGIEADHTETKAVDDLAKAMSAAKPTKDSQLVEFSSPSNESTARAAFWILATATASPFRIPEKPTQNPEGPNHDRPQARPTSSAAVSVDARRQRLRRVLKVPVQVVVHLADKKIEMGQLLSIAPGSLIAFDKNCEDLLDLYINNRLYCRGEAVKIGENFGLKVNELGVVRRRVERVL